ncbi:AAA family ATPase [Roseburia sp. OM04-10AA]|uniref:AAA family ATPase n=1 Tax=Roseburia sp. OM04-10AA TaxID=2293141 RepID=UPI001FAA039D|nr:ATP-binding protein [Roseburia sp. OM04-10AA]
MFIGRDRELKTLDKLYHSDKFEFVVIYGRRRVGKTALINHFIDDKQSIYFMGVESNEKQNLENLSKSILEYSNGIETDTYFASYQAALEYVFKLAERERVILTIDEYPYVARESKSLASTLQLLIDKYKDTSKLMLILCGSSMSYMEDHVLAYKAPLYGRRTAQMKIMPFDFEESCRYLKNMSDEEKAIIYGIVGGTPQYLLQINDKMSVEENIRNTFLNPMSFLYEEPMNLLKQEVREPAIYTAIITAIATGHSRMSEISTKVGEDTNVCSGYLKNLINLGIIKKETPYGEKTSKKSIYSIEDNMFCFWYRFVLDNNSIIVRGAADLVYKKIEHS